MDDDMDDGRRPAALTSSYGHPHSPPRKLQAATRTYRFFGGTSAPSLHFPEHRIHAAGAGRRQRHGAERRRNGAGVAAPGRARASAGPRGIRPVRLCDGLDQHPGLRGRDGPRLAGDAQRGGISCPAGMGASGRRAAPCHHPCGNAQHRHFGSGRRLGLDAVRGRPTTSPPPSWPDSSCCRCWRCCG